MLQEENKMDSKPTGTVFDGRSKMDLTWSLWLVDMLYMIMTLIALTDSTTCACLLCRLSSPLCYL